MSIEARLFVALLWAVVALCVWWALDRAPPITFMPVEAPVQVVAGEQARIPVRFVRHRACAVSIDSWIIDSASGRFDYPDQQNSGRGRAGEELHFYLLQMIPAAAAAGPAVMTRVVAYRCNPLHWFWPIVRERDIPLIIARAS